MAGGFNFSIDFDSSQFKRGSDDAAASLEKLSESLTDVERSDVSDVERGVKDLGDAADTSSRQADDLARQFSDTFQKARDDSRDAGEVMGENLEGPLTATQDMMNEVRASIGESMGELAGSFAENGFNMEDAIDGVVEVAAEAAQALPGPFGIAGSALVATAAGVYGEWKARLEAISERASEMYDDMIESGADFLSNEFFQGQLRELFNPMGESFESNMEKIDILGKLGIPTDEAARAMVGYGDESDAALEKVRDAINEMINTTDRSTGAWAELEGTGLNALNGLQNDLEDSRKSTVIAEGAVRDYRDSIAEIPKNKDTDVNVDDKGSVKTTQDAIDAMRGKDVTVNVKGDMSSLIYDIGIFRPPSVEVPVTFRYGEGAP